VQVGIARVPEAAKARCEVKKLSKWRQKLADDGHCMAGRDGECEWDGCPQLRDNEPHKSGRHCPRDVRDAAEARERGEEMW